MLRTRRVSTQIALLIVTLSAIMNLCGSVAPLAAQVTPGYPNFSSYDRHEYDTVDLMNKNIVVSYPGMHKAGSIPVSMTTWPSNYYFFVWPSNTTWMPPSTNFGPAIPVTCSPISAQS